MKENIENKISAFTKLAQASILEKMPKSRMKNLTESKTDSLSKAIRNEEEANIFMTELQSVIEHS